MEGVFLVEGGWANFRQLRGTTIFSIPLVGKIPYVGCSYHCPDQLQFLSGHWQAKMPWIYQWFFINLQMLAEWEFAFPNTIMIIFCLIYLLNIHHTFLLTFQYQSLQKWRFNDMSLYWSEWGTYTKLVLTFLFVWFYHCRGRRTCVWFWWQYKVSDVGLVFLLLTLNIF